MVAGIIKFCRADAIKKVVDDLNKGKPIKEIIKELAEK